MILAVLNKELRWSDPWRQVACAWLMANGIDPNNVPRDADVEVVLVDAPFVRYSLYVQNEKGKRILMRCGGTHEWNAEETVFDCTCTPRTEKKVKLLMVEMPEELKGPNR